MSPSFNSTPATEAINQPHISEYHGEHPPNRFVSVVGTGSHYPPYEMGADHLGEITSRFYDIENPAVQKTLQINANSRINSRRTAIPHDNPYWKDSRLPDIADCDALFKKYGVPIAEEAARKALIDWNGSANDISHIVVVTCTNTANPGLDFMLCQRLSLHRNVQRTLLHGVGCAGGAAALRTATDLLLGAAYQGKPGNALVVACEITSMFYRSVLEDIVKTQEVNIGLTLFGDGAGAVVLSNGVCSRASERAPLWNILNSRSTLLEDSARCLEFNVHPHGYNPVISKDVPKHTSAALSCGFRELITSTPSLCSDESNFDPSLYDWALHPGGYNIVRLAQTALGITEHHLRKSYDVSRTKGNTSSTTLMSVIHELAKEQDTTVSGREKVIVASFGPGLEVLDSEMGKDEWLIAFAPITLLSAGGFLAVNFFRNRDSTGDLDYLLEPQWAHDNDIKEPLQGAMSRAARILGFTPDWANEEMAFFVPDWARERLFQEAKKQNIVLWQGTNLRILAVPLEWALERKMRRVHNSRAHTKRGSDMDDALALLRYLSTKNRGPLDREHVRTMNMCSNDMRPDRATMDEIAAAYREKYGEEAFS
ncbi:Chitin synthase, class 1 [Aspergillus nanangensis]|uniref:Chitin synthase, class 1 n=1 Tax=Aspergillus nanangensis TaxID=2582783 RepID=A0AAD4GZR0_ASPNN|nr:Chitin synthase, class 1 [Aspergillus nanangensis]